jgi:hypothetical protein
MEGGVPKLYSVQLGINHTAFIITEPHYTDIYYINALLKLIGDMRYRILVFD